MTGGPTGADTGGPPPDPGPDLPVVSRSWARRHIVGLVAILVLIALPFLVVAALDLVAHARFVQLEAASDPPMASPGRRYDAFQHAYASGVVAVVLGESIAHAAGMLVEFVEQNSCRDREHDLINNALGRERALMLAADGNPDWRRELAKVLHAEIADPDGEFSVVVCLDSRLDHLCRSD